jgi:lipid-binding SYLF domain-containing protein
MAFDRIIHEVKLVGLVTLYFMACFALVLTLKKLFLAQYSLEIYGISAAVVGALVVGKVVVLLDHTRLGNRFDQGHALWRGALYKTVTSPLCCFPSRWPQPDRRASMRVTFDLPRRFTVMKRVLVCMLAVVLVASFTMASAEEGKKKKASVKRSEIDSMAGEALVELTNSSKSASKLLEQAYGYAVFDNLKIAIGVSGGGGTGVAVAKDGSERVYMKMGTAGVGVGLGGQKYQVIFLFESQKKFRSFVDTGWTAEAGAQAAAGTEGVSAETTFHDGIAIYKITDKGLMASADVSGTKYWKHKKLN